MTMQTRVPKMSASVDGGPSGGSRVRRPGSEDPHRRERNSSLLSADSAHYDHLGILLLLVSANGVLIVAS